MVDKFGNWTAEKDYSVYPKEKWCDMDYVAAWIKKLGYSPKTSIENLCGMIVAHYYYDDDEREEKGYFAIKDDRKYPDNLMIYIPDVEAYVEASGGLAEFDYYC